MPAGLCHVSKIQKIYRYFTENTSMDFQKVIYENVGKKHLTTNISTYTGHRNFEVL